MGSITLTNFCLLNNPYWDKYWWAMVSHLFFKCITRFELLTFLLDICVPVFMSAFLLPYDVFMIFLKLIYTVQQWSQSRLDFLSTSLLLLSSVSCHTCIFIFCFLLHGFILYVFLFLLKSNKQGVREEETELSGFSMCGFIARIAVLTREGLVPCWE